MTDRFAQTPQEHYFAVIFTSQMTDELAGYADMSEEILELALRQPGCLGADSARDTSGFGLTVSYWENEESISRWKSNARHIVAQKMGIERWYDHYEIRVAKVERSYSGPRGRGNVTPNSD